MKRSLPSASRARVGVGRLALLGVCLGAPVMADGQVLVLDQLRLIDGRGGEPVPLGRVVIEDGRITAAGAASAVAVPEGAQVLPLGGRSVLPGLIDLHFHIEQDPDLALRQLAHGITSFRDPGQWEEAFTALRETLAAEDLPGPRIFTAGPHLDGENPAYPRDAVVVRDPEEARRAVRLNVAAGATAIKLYFRLPLASARAAIAACRELGIPSTAHVEILDAGELIEAGLDGVEHVTSFGAALLPRREREAYRQAVLADSDARRAGRYRIFAEADLDGEEARRLFEIVRRRRPFVDPTLAVFEVRPGAPAAGASPAEHARRVAGFAGMQRLTWRLHREGARVVLGGHSTVPFADRGEAPFRELELLVESGLTPLEAIGAATREAAAFLFRSDLGILEPGRRADLIVVPGDPSEDVSALRDVERVMVGGRWVDVASLRSR